MAQAPKTLRRYVELPGDVVGRLPFVARECVSHFFLFKADPDSLKRLVDRALNIPGGDEVRFSLVTPYVLLGCVYAPGMGSKDPVHSQRGVVPETDVGFWILTFGGGTSPGAKWKLRWLPVYLFVDSGAAMAGGREVFGFPKQDATIMRPGGDQHADPRVAVGALSFERYGPREVGKIHKLLEIGLVGGPVPPPGPADLTGFDDALRRALFNETDLVSSLNLPGILSLLSGRGSPLLGLPTVSLKQVRDHAIPNKATHQAIVETFMASDNIDQIGWFPRKQKLHLFPSASHPIAEDLGLSTPAEPVFAAWVKHDFTAQFGQTIVEL